MSTECYILSHNIGRNYDKLFTSIDYIKNVGLDNTVALLVQEFPIRDLEMIKNVLHQDLNNFDLCLNMAMRSRDGHRKGLLSAINLDMCYQNKILKQIELNEEPIMATMTIVRFSEKQIAPVALTNVYIGP